MVKVCESVESNIIFLCICRPSICLSLYLLLNHWVEFNQNCYITSPHSKVVQEQHYFSMCPSVCASVVSTSVSHTVSLGDGLMRQRCRVSCINGASNWDWLTVGQGLLSLQQVRVEGGFFFSSASSLSFIFLFLLVLSFISSTVSSISLLPFSGRWHKMTHKGWRVIKPQHNQLHYLLLNHWAEFNQTLHHFPSWKGCTRATLFFCAGCLSICPSCYLLLNYWAEFNQTCYITSSNG